MPRQERTIHQFHGSFLKQSSIVDLRSRSASVSQLNRSNLQGSALELQLVIGGNVGILLVPDEYGKQIVGFARVGL